MSAAGYMTSYNRSGQQAIGAATNVAFDDSGDGLAWVFQANTADPITHLGFRYGARTGTPPTYRASLQTPTAAGGVPDTTVLGGGSPASVTFTPPADATWNGTWQWVQLANAYTPSRGQLLASCLEYSSGTIDGSNTSSFTAGMATFKQASGFPYRCLKTAGTWAKVDTANICFGYRTANGRYGYVTTGSFTTTIGTSGHRATMHFTLPAGYGDTFQLAGASMAWEPPTTGQSPIFGLWNAAGTLLASKTLDTDIITATTAGGHEFLFGDATLPTLSYGTKYYIGFESASTSAQGLLGAQLGASADRSAWPDGLIRGYSLWNGSVWTDDDTVIPLCELIFADITEPGAADYPSEDDVRDGVSFDTGAQIGNMTLPAITDVASGVQYGTSGTEFTGTLAGGSGVGGLINGGLISRK